MGRVVAAPSDSPRAVGAATLTARLHRLACVLVLFVAFVAPALADEFRPAHLQLKQIDAATYDVLWRVPALDANTTLRLQPVFPDGTQELTERSRSYASNAAVLRWRIRVDGGMTGKAVEFPQLQGSRVDVLVRLERADGTEQLGRVLPVDPRFRVTSSPGHLEVVKTYTVLGIGHILLGFDHLLFVLALLLIVDGTRRLIATITAFTIAHSITLALASLGVLHVLGFASALAEVGLPPNSIPLALLFFNVGVEIGQLIFIAAALLLIAAGTRMAASIRCRSPSWFWRVPPYAIGGMASYWVFERVAGF